MHVEALERLHHPVLLLIFGRDRGGKRVPRHGHPEQVQAERVPKRESVVQGGDGGRQTGSVGRVEVIGWLLVGRRHEESWLMSELTKWKEHGELGMIGEILASFDIIISATILVVQQHTRVWGLRVPEESLRLKRESTRQNL